jgi:hypothetical protein
MVVLASKTNSSALAEGIAVSADGRSGSTGNPVAKSAVAKKHEVVETQIPHFDRVIHEKTRMAP